MRGLLGTAAVVVYLALATAASQAQLDAKADGAAASEAPPRSAGAEPLVQGKAANEDRALDHWWLGGYFRHLWIPSYMIKPFFDRAPSVTNNGAGLVATYRTGGGLNVQMGLGFMPYGFDGPLLADGQPDTDTELIASDLTFFHLTGSLLWDIEFHKTVALEIGFGIDAGFLTGEIKRDEAYFDDASKSFRRCRGPLDPDTTSPADPDTGTPGELYCAPPENGSDESDDPDDEGEHYGVEEGRVPPVFLFPMVPHVALRVQPFKHLTLKAELGFGVVQVWVGVSLHASFGLFEKGPSELLVKAESDVVSGRVLGRVVDSESGSAVSGATVKLQGTRALSALATDAEGRFVVDRLDVGSARFEVAHPDYSEGQCDVDIPRAGGDVAVECPLTPRARVGAISGQIEGEGGTPVKGASLELSGPQSAMLVSDERGTFAAVDVPAGKYRVRVQADGYLAQVVEVEVIAHETAMPQIILLKKPARSLVQLRKKEIAISEQVQFATASAELLAESDNLLRQVADLLLREPSIELVEVQGHTDSKGGRELNMTLSQQRADAVREWLVKAGIADTRLQAKGYGPEQPIRPNNTAANRAINRRVQFIIRQQSAEMDPE